MAEGSGFACTGECAAESGTGLPVFFQQSQNRISEIQILQKKQAELYNECREWKYPSCGRKTKTAETERNKDQTAPGDTGRICTEIGNSQL